MKFKWKPFVTAIAIPLAVGGLSALLSRGSMEAFDSLNKPALAPPGWLFPVVWTLLYLSMGVASYLVYVSDAPRENVMGALWVYAAQLVVNFFWTLIFFNWELYLFAFFWLLLLWVLVLATAVLFYRISRPAGLLMLPYLLWVTFAGYLNLAIYLLN